jgi:hypothetical protein
MSNEELAIASPPALPALFCSQSIGEDRSPNGSGLKRNRSAPMGNCFGLRISAFGF